MQLRPCFRMRVVCLRGRGENGSLLSGEDEWEVVGSSPSLVVLRLLTTTTTSNNDYARLRSQGCERGHSNSGTRRQGSAVHPWPLSALAASRGRPKRRVYPLFSLPIPPGCLRAPLHTTAQNSRRSSMQRIGDAEADVQYCQSSLFATVYAASPLPSISCYLSYVAGTRALCSFRDRTHRKGPQLGPTNAHASSRRSNP